MTNNSEIHSSRKGSSETLTHKVLELAFDLFDFYSSSTSEPVAVRRHGPNVALPFQGRGASLRAVLGEELLKRKGLVLTEKAFKEAIQILSAEAYRNQVDIPLRVGGYQNKWYVDLGDSTGQCIEIGETGWQICDRSPVPFIRTVLTTALPRPTNGGSVDEIFEYINIPVHMRDLFIGCLVASFFEDVPHPVIQFDGEQGSGKSFAAQLFTDLIDPSLIPRRKPPKDIETWTTTAQGSYVIGIDNVAQISPFFSDALCRAVTGEGNVERELFTNGGLFISKFRRIVVINGIRITGIQDDLADRLIRFKLPVITNSARRTERDILTGWQSQRPLIYGALLDLAVKTMEALPKLTLNEMPRMADFSRVLAAMDLATGSSALDQYLDEVNLSAVASVSEDPYIEFIKKMIGESWSGSSKQLLELSLSQSQFQPLPSGFPEGARSMTNYLTKVAPTLRKAGWVASDLGNANHENVTVWHLAPPTT